MSVRQDLESITSDPKWLQLFEDRLKRSYNYHNLAFWVALKELKAFLEVCCTTHTQTQTLAFPSSSSSLCHTRTWTREGTGEGRGEGDDTFFCTHDSGLCVAELLCVGVCYSPLPSLFVVLFSACRTALLGSIGRRNFFFLPLFLSLSLFSDLIPTPFHQTASEGALPAVQERMDSILQQYFDTESAQSVALSFKAKERFKRSRGQPLDEMKKAIDLSSREVEMLLVGEVKTFLAEAPPPSASRSPRPSTNSITSPRDDVAAKRVTSTSAATTTTTGGAPPAARPSPTASYDLRNSASPQLAQQQATTALSSGSRTTKVLPNPSANPSVATTTTPSTPPPQADSSSSSLMKPVTRVVASPSVAIAPSRSTTRGKAYPWDVAPNEEPYPREYSERMALFAWGENGVDQLGVATGAEKTVSSPVQVTGSIENMVYVACSENYSIGVDVNGQAYCTGKSIESPVFVPFLEGHVVRQIACGLQFCIALLDSGRLLYFGFANRAMERLPLPETVTKILCGNRHCIALTNQGHVYTWGSDEKQQLGHGGADRVPKPLLLQAVDDVVDVAAGQNSSACVSASGHVYAWGVVAAPVRSDVIQVEDLRTKNIFRVACSDKYVVGLSDLGRVFIWHPEAVLELSLPVVPNTSICLRSASVFHVHCFDSVLFALTDTGDVITWGDYRPALGQGPQVATKKYAETPMRVPKFQVTAARRLAASDKHVLVATGDGTSRREALVWELFVRERDFGRMLFIMVDEYGRRIKIKDAPNLFKHIKVLQDHHTLLLREFFRLLEVAPRSSYIDVGPLYVACYSTSEVVEVHRSWVQEMALPLEKLSRPKLAAQLADIEAEVEALAKKTDSPSQATHSFSLVSLLREPPKHLQWLHEQLTLLLHATPEEHPDRPVLQRVLLCLVNCNGGTTFPHSERVAQHIAAAGASGPPPALPPGTRTDDHQLARSSKPVIDDISKRQIGAEGVDELIQERMRFRALQMELDIFRDANVELVRYAKALEQEVLSGKSASRFGSIEGIQQWEDEIVALASENAELRARVRLLDVYRSSLAQFTGVKDTGSQEDSFASDEIPAPVSSNGKNLHTSHSMGSLSQSAVSKNSPAKSRTDGVSTPISGSPSVSTNRVHGAASSTALPRTLLDGSGGRSSENINLSSSSTVMNMSSGSVGPTGGGGGGMPGNGEQALRKRINPAAGRLLSEGEGGAARSLEQFTFDDGNKVGVQYSGTELKAATLEKLLEFLIQSSGSLALNTFLISYRNFASPQDVLRRLVYMYCTAPRDKAKVVWVRVLNFFKNWCVTFYEEDWQNDEYLRNDLTRFLDDIVVPSFPNSAALAVNAIRDRFRVGGSTTQAIRVPIKPSGPLVLSKYKPAEVAEQLILSEHECFRAIKPGECFNQNWVKKNKSDLSPNIVNLTNRFNKLSRWVAFEICQHMDVKERKAALERWITVAQLCREQYRAFGITMMIMGGITSSAVYRLRRTWDALSRAHANTFNELKDFTKTEKNFENLREATRTADLPCYPYIGTYLGDLTFIDTGSLDYTGEGLINWNKFQATANTLLRLQALQKTGYTFDVISEWHQFLYHLPFEHTEQELYELSKRAESTAPTK